MNDEGHSLHIGLVGSDDFIRRLRPDLTNACPTGEIHTAGLADAWSMILSDRPELLLIGIERFHTASAQSALRYFLDQLRDRYSNEVYVAVVLTSSETIAYGGDLLFKTTADLSPSLFVDTFLVQPPASVPSAPSLGAQIANLITLFTLENSRRLEGQTPLPALGAPGWVQSLADPKSRELWMQWLPRYASYTNENPCIIGLTGTGKTNLAYALHLLSGLDGEFIGITPRDFSSSELVQAELFGAVEGAYTGAVDKWGLVKKAERGSLFIDELQSIDKDLQGKLITFIENKVYRRVGSSDSVEADVRFIFASNKRLYDMMTSDVLRDDFAYRLERMQLWIPPLAERRLDITAALGYALAKVHRQRPNHKLVKGLSKGAYRILYGYNWPGNLRQLENTAAKLWELTDIRGDSVISEDVVHEILKASPFATHLTSSEIFAEAAERFARTALAKDEMNISDGVRMFVEVVRCTALEVSGGNTDKAAEFIQDHKKLIDFTAREVIARQFREDSK